MNRTTAIEECQLAASVRESSIVLVYFFLSQDCSAKGLFYSLIKQLLGGLIKMNQRCPEDIRHRIEDAFGLAHHRPEVIEVIDGVLIQLLSIFEETTVVVDGIDICEQRERIQIWTHFGKILASKKSRTKLLVSGRDEIGLGNYLPDFEFERIRMDRELNQADIDVYTEAQMALEAGQGRLFSDPSLRKLVKDYILMKASGM